MDADPFLEQRLFPWMRRPSSQALLLLVMVLGAGLISVLVMRRDTNWDLVNYHFYNPWAFLNGRMEWDIAPAQLQSYISPLVDLPFYLMVAAGWPARLIAFVMGVPAGIGAFFLLHILARFFDKAPPATRVTLVVLAAVIGLTGTAAVSMLGSTMNEWPGAAMLLAAVWLTLPRAARAMPSTRALLCAGLLAGIACGLKLTAAPFALGLVCAVLASATWFGSGLRNAALCVAGAALGFVATAGFWLWKLAALYASPLFPFFNQWLGSPWFEHKSIVPRVFGPTTAWGWLTFPLPLFHNTAMYFTEMPMRDWRLPLVYLLVLAVAALSLVRQRARLPAAMPVARANAARYLLAFVLVSVVLWCGVYAVYRYLVSVEVLLGALIIYLLSHLVAGAQIRVVAACATALVLVNVTYPNWGHLPFDGPYVQVRVPPIQPNTLVLLVNPQPIAYVAPFFPPDARFIGLNSNMVSPARHDRMQERVVQVLQQHAGPIVSIAYAPGAEVPAVLGAYRLAQEPGCRSIVSNMATSPIALCDVRRVAAAQ